jgi:hypothetical protein
VLIEKAGEIVSVPARAVFDLWMKHERFAQSVVSQEILKLGGEWNGPLLAVFEIHSRRFPQMEQSSFQIEPERAGLDDFVLPQTGMEAAILNEFQIVAFRRSDELVALLFGAEISESRPEVARQIQTIAGIAATDSGDMNAPVEKRAENHRIRVGRGSRMLARFGIVERLYARQRDVRGGNGADMAGERFQDESAPVRAGSREFVLAPFVSEKGINLSLERTAGIKGRSRPHFDRASNGLGEVGSFQADKMTFAGSLKIQPVNRAAQIDTARSRVGRHAGCNTRTVTLVNSGLWIYPGNMPVVEEAGDGYRTHDILLGKKAVCRANCHAQNVTGGQI